VDEIESMYAAGARVFVESGPGRVLTHLVDRILGDRPHLAVACDTAGDHGLHRFLLALAQLAANGVDVDLAPLFDGRDARADRLAAAARPAGWTINGHLVRGADGRPVAGSLQPVDTAPDVALALGGPGRTGVPGDRDAAVLEYLRGAREVMAAEREITVPTAPVVATAPSAAIEATATDGGGGPVARAALTPDEVMTAVLAIVSERTGYPLDMLDPDLDLEADLSIDSIKRIEIVGELADRVGLPGADEGSIDESVVEELAQLKTLRGIVDWIAALGDREAGDGPAAEEDADAGEPAAVGPTVEVPAATLRYVVELAEVGPPAEPPGPGSGAFSGQTFAIVDDGQGVALHLSTLLEERGATVRLLAADDRVSGDGVPDGEGSPALDGLIHLAFLAHGTELPLATLFTQVKGPVLAGLRHLVVATGLGGGFGRGPAQAAGDLLPASSGAHGLARTVAREFPDCRVLAIDLDPKDDPSHLAEHLLAELCAGDGLVDVGRTNGTRQTLRVLAAELDEDAVAASLPVVGADSVVLLTGGARGITASWWDARPCPRATRTRPPPAPPMPSSCARPSSARA
jgi:acyl transferase domain-containing protein